MAHGWQVLHLAGICLLLDYLPAADQVSFLDDERVFEAMRDLDRRYAEDPCLVATSGRLLLVARRPE